MKKIYIYAPFFIIAITIFILSHQTSTMGLFLFPHQDKLLHAISYFFLTYALERIFKFYGTKDILGHAFTAIIIMLFAISDEFHQYFIPNRIADPYDLLADYIGMMFALAISNHCFKADRLIYSQLFGKI